MASVDPEGNAIQASTEGPEAVRFAATSVTVEAATTATALEVSAIISASDEPVVDIPLVQDEPIFASRPIVERGSGSSSAEFSPANDIMEELARQMVQ